MSLWCNCTGDATEPVLAGGRALMLAIAVSHDGDRPLVDQIVAGIKRQIDDRNVRPGARLPSIRQLRSEAHDVSRFTVVEAYDRLVAAGYLQSRSGAGFLRRRRRAPSQRRRGAGGRSHERNEELVWLIRRLLDAEEDTVLARRARGSPIRWLDEAGIRQSPQFALARKNGALPARVRQPASDTSRLREHSVAAISASSASRRKPSADRPDPRARARRSNSSSATCSSRATPPSSTTPATTTSSAISVVNDAQHPRRAAQSSTAPTSMRLETLAAAHRPKLYFTQSDHAEPDRHRTRARTSRSACSRSAERRGFMRRRGRHFQRPYRREPTPRLATLDQLRRVIYARSFSKTLSGSLRVGFIACRRGRRQRAQQTSRC